MVTRSRAPSWVGLPTSCIASVSPRGADAAARLTLRHAASCFVNHRAARRPGGFLLSENTSPAGQRPRGQEPEGT
jgi:hypothetical protein